MTLEQPDEVAGEPPEPDGLGIPLCSSRSPTPRPAQPGPLDLASPSAAAQAALVDRLTGLGATPADVGQGDVTWTVLADPEGNERCVQSPR